MSTTNPLLATSDVPFGAVPFERIRHEHFLPALEVAIAEAKANVKAIKADSRPPDFDNTIAALEKASAKVYEIAYAYGNLRAANGDPAMHALAKEIMPRLIELESDVNLDPELFARVKAVSEKPGVTGEEKKTLVDKTYRSFRRNGGLLGPKEKERLRALDEELSTLGPQFSEHVLKDTNSYELVIADKAKLRGLPESALEGAAATAVEKGKKDAWVFTLQGPSFVSFLRYAEDRELRRQLWTAYLSRAVSGANSNKDLVKKIASLRLARARLLGYESHAHFQMEERMAERPDRVEAFMQRLVDKSKPAALREMAELRKFTQESGGPAELMPWDYAFWSNKLKEKLFDLNTEELRPYFPLDSVLAGAFEHARRLYDLDFREVKGVPVYAEDVQVFEVVDKIGHKGLFYADFFPRGTKAAGAWCTRFRGQWQEGASDVRPHVSIVCNFTKPTATKPSLLTFQEVKTLFHEFGHALHSLLSRCEHRSLSCTNVYRDFVELPSQIMENWIVEKESLALFAKHWQTGEVIPEKYVQKIVAAENFHAAYQMMRQLRFGLLDLAWYGSKHWQGKTPADVDVEAFELEAVKDTDLMPNVPGTNMSVSFEHIFSGGYSAGYYGYKWAEVLDADAFEYFKERGIFSREVADRFRTEVLEKGGTEHPMELYRRFRGREPDPDALLRRSQLI